MILDRFVPPQRPAADSIWIDPPAQGSPVPVRTRVERRALLPLGLRIIRRPRACTPRISSWIAPSVFEAGAGDGRVAEVDAGPVIVARPGKPKIVVLGFHPALTGMRYELATPLLFANLLRWMSPEIFRR